MKLCVDIGNSQIHLGLFEEERLVLRLRRGTERGSSSDQLGLFFRQGIRENGFDPDDVNAFALCSVVPDLNHSMGNAAKRYFRCEPFVLRAGVKTGLKVKYKNPLEVGSDRIAGAIGAVNKYPDRNILIIDFGTATTIEAVSQKKEYLGGAIAPGLGVSMRALESNTARLPKVEIVKPSTACGLTTIESIQSGLFWGHIGLIRELSSRIRLECFEEEDTVIITTGGFASLLSGSGLFDQFEPNLVLEGTRIAQELNS